MKKINKKEVLKPRLQIIDTESRKSRYGSYLLVENIEVSTFSTLTGAESA